MAKLKELKSWCKVFAKAGLAPSYNQGAFGNLSFRVKPGSNEFIITASGFDCEKSCSNKDFVLVQSVDLKSQTVFSCGQKQPSSESMLHFALYQARPELGAIFHGHCDIILHNYQRLNIPCTKKEQLYGSLGLVKEVLAVLDKEANKQINFIIMKNHGFLALSKDMAAAGQLALKILKDVKDAKQA